MKAGQEPFVLPGPAGTLIFGMEWFPIMRANPARAAAKLARQHGATHAVLPTTAFTAVGCVSLNKQVASDKRGLYSAAQNVAQLYANGSAAILLELPQSGYWLVAIHDGAVVARTDCIYSSQEEAEAIINSLQQAYPQLQVLVPGQGSQLPTLAMIQSCCSSLSQLQSLPRWKSVTPWPVQCLALALMLVLLWPHVNQLFSARPAAANDLPVVDPKQAWRMSVAASIHGRYVHGGNGTRVLLEMFYGLPTALEGWLLQQASCELAGALWKCQANYLRQSSQADNDAFLAVASPAWQVDFTSLDSILVRWEQNAYGTPLARLGLFSVAHNERYLLSALQAIKPGFAQIQTGRSTPVPVKTPNDAQGQPLARPKDVGAYFSRDIKIVGPLRSASLLPSVAAHIAWQKVALTLSATPSPGLTGSKLNVSLQGVIYEMDHANGHLSDTDVCSQLDGGSCTGP